jgi:1-carboxybiuret hydrolase subunit AtzH-like protein
MLDVDIPDVLAELTATFEQYERALIDNDIAALNELFWDSPKTLRYGTRKSEHLYGHAEIAAFRIRRGPVDQRRILRGQRITTFGRDFGVTNVEFIPAGSDALGRQSQTWVRTDKGWKIVSAHVSFGT